MTRTRFSYGAPRTSHSMLDRMAAVAVAAAVASALVLTVLAAAASAEPLFVVTGRGNGHGIGLSQVGSMGYAKHGWTYRQILAHYYQKTTLGTLANNPVVRVALDLNNASRVAWTVRAVDGKLRVVGDDGAYKDLPAGQFYSLVVGRVSGKVIGAKVFFDKDGDGVQETGDTWVMDAAVKARVTQVSVPSGGVSAVQVHSHSGLMDWSDVRYRGTIRVVPGDMRVWGFNDVLMEDYVPGVVPRESESGYPIEALKAQAVAARSYAYKSFRTASTLFDVYPDTKSQAYNGYGRVVGSTTQHHEVASTNLATVQTARQVVKYGSAVVMTFFDASMGGRSENIENVWAGTDPQPYYVSVDSPYEPAGTYHNIWPAAQFSASTLRARLLAQGASVPAVLSDVVVTRRGAGGRCLTVVLKGAAGDDKTITLADMAKFRRAVGGHDNWIYITRSVAYTPKYVQYGVPSRTKVIVSPSVTGVVTVAYGPRGAASLPYRAKASVVRGVGYVQLPGLAGASEVAVWSGSPGTATCFQSPRARIYVVRRSSVQVGVAGRSLTMTASVKPAMTGLRVYFDVRAPGNRSSWVRVGSAPMSAQGIATLNWKATSAGTWSVRVYTPTAGQFVAGISSSVNVTVK